MTEPTATLIISSYSSTCSACGGGAFPSQLTHETRAGYGANGQPGCGALFTAIDHDRPFPSKGLLAKIREMRPDLPFKEP